MSGIYYSELADVLSSAGVRVGVNNINAGWEHRARSSGGFPSAPLAVFWHHTASKTTIENDLSWQINGSPDAPVGNMTIARDGVVWPIAAGASNCAGKGGPATFSRGTIPKDNGNTRGWQIEVANNGVGEQWPTAQIDAYFASSNALNAHFGNKPSDIITHQAYAPDRKIDPATADAVQGPWRPRDINSSGTWNLNDIKDECDSRAVVQPPVPVPPGDDEVRLYVVLYPNSQAQYVTDMATFKTPITDPGVQQEGIALFGWTPGWQDGFFPLGPGWAPFLDQLPTTQP